MNRREVHRKPEDTLLTERAAKFLENGPADVVDLIGYICNLPAAPRIVAEHMAEAMFAGRTEFRRDESGKWLLVGGTTAALPAFEARVEMPSVEYPRRRGRQNKQTRAKSEIPSTPLKSMSWVVVDVETTGGSPPSDRITEIAAVVVRDGKIAEVFESLINPMRPIPSFVSKLTNITWNMVKNAPTFDRVAPDVLKALEGNVFVAHNAAFDWKFVSHEVTRATGARLFGQRLCTVRLAKGVLPGLPRCSLDFLANHYGVEISGRHRAGGDAIATAHCLIRLLRDAEDRGCSTWDDLEVLLRGRPQKKKKRRYSALPSPVTRDTTA